jgi:hypothetical protein
MHHKFLLYNIQGITKPAIRRLARRGGVKMISGLISVVDHFSRMGKIGNHIRVCDVKLPMNHKITYSC